MQIQEVNKPKEKIRLDCLLTCLYFLCMPFSIVPFIGDDFSLLKLVSLGTGAVLLITMFLGKQRLSFNMVHFWTIFYMLYTVFTFLIDSDQVAIETFWSMFQIYLIIILISIRVYNKREKRLIENVWLIIGFICIILGATSSSTVGEEGRTTLTILGATEDPNQFCAYFILPALYAMKRIITPHERKKIFFIIYEVAVVYVLFRSGSRGGLLSVAAPLIYYVLTATKGIKVKIISVVSLALAAVIFMTVVYPLLPDSVIERYSIQRVEEDRGTHRLDLWEYILSDVTQDKRLLICGGGMQYTAKILKKTIYDNAVAHNQWVQVLADQGLIGVALFFSQIMAAFIRNVKHKKELSASMIGVVVLSMSLTIYTFKPYLNIVLMASTTYEDEIEYESYQIRELSKTNKKETTENG